MNDIEEVVFGFRSAANVVRESQIIKDALVTKNRFNIFHDAYQHYVAKFEEENLLDTYVFCFSEHDPDDLDGLLSMWRGYGSDGRGVAIVFDTTNVTPQEGTSLTLAKVFYLSPEERIQWISEKVDQFATLIDSIDLPDDKIYLAAYALFDRVRLFSLFTKHIGFCEEKEWRIVYLSGRGSDKGLPVSKHYLTTSRGVEPKLRLKIKPSDDFVGSPFSFDQIVDSIIIGPSAQPTLAAPAFQRMLDLIGKSDLSDRIIVSSIPYRAG